MVSGVCLTFTWVVVCMHLLCLAVYILPGQVHLLEPALPVHTSHLFCLLLYHPPGAALHPSQQVHLLILGDIVFLGFLPHQ